MTGATRDCRPFDIQHAVLPTKLPLAEFCAELIGIQRAIYAKHLGWRGLSRAGWLALRLAMRGQTNFLRSMMRLNSVYRPELLLADHGRPVAYEIPPSPRHDATATGRSLYVRAPRGRSGRAIDADTERFVDETRVGAEP